MCRYRSACAKLINQFKTARKVTQPYVPDVRQFMRDYRLDCEAALDRLESGAHTIVFTSEPFRVLLDALQKALDFHAARLIDSLALSQAYLTIRM